MNEDLVFLLLLAAISFLFWVFFRRKPDAPEPRMEREGSHTKPKGPPIPRMRTPKEIEEDRRRLEQEREQDRLDEIEDRINREEIERARLKDEKRKIIEAAQRRMKEEEEGRRRRAAREAANSTVGREFARYISMPVPPEIKRSMRAFLAGEFVGADRSPLAYVGYRVGKTNGLPAWDRNRRLQVCFRIDIPSEIRRDYSSWAGPGSHERLNAMIAHIKMLAAMRRERPGYEVAVSEWERDAEWLRSELGELAEKFSRHGVTW